MSDRESLGPVQIRLLNVGDINAAFRELVGRIDALKGLRGRTIIYDRVRVSDPVETNDAVANPVVASTIDHGQLTGNADDDHTQYLLLNGRVGGQTILTAKPLYFKDSNGTIIHQFST